MFERPEMAESIPALLGPRSLGHHRPIAQELEKRMTIETTCTQPGHN